GKALDQVLDDIYRQTGKKLLMKKIQRYNLDLSKERDRRDAVLEYIAHVAEEGKQMGLVRRVVAALRDLIRKVYPGIGWNDTDTLALIAKSKLHLQQEGTRGISGMNKVIRRDNNDIGNLFRLSDDLANDTSLTDDQKAALSKIGPKSAAQTAMDRVRDTMTNWRLKVRQGLVDRYAGLLELDKQLLDGNVTSEENITRSAWVKARMSNAAGGAVSAMMNAGRIVLDADGVIDVNRDTSGLIYTLNQLGSAAEVERFMGWIAGNRGEKLMAEGRENLFSPEDIAALKDLNTGTMPDGRDRNATYEKVFAEFQQHRDDVLAIAEKAGIITSENREMWA